MEHLEGGSVPAADEFDPVRDLPPIFFRPKSAFKPPLQVREVTESKEMRIPVLVGFPNGIIGETRIRDE